MKCPLCYTFGLLFFGLIHGALGQQRLAGKVVDAATGQPVPYASVSVLNTRLGTTSNADGEFELRAPLPYQLVVSELGHRRDTIAVASAQALQIRLQPTSVLLPEATTGTYVEELIKKAYRQLRRTNAQKTYGQAFYRQVTRQDGDATEVQEMVWNAKAGNGGVEGTSLAQGRYAEKEALLKFKNFSLYTKAHGIFNAQTDSSLSMMVVSPNVARNYTLHLMGVTQDGPRQLIEIGFASKAGVNPHHYRGSLIIDEDSYQVLRFRLENNDLQLKSNNPIFKFKDQTTVFEWVFRPAPGGAATLDYVKVNYQGMVGRLLKPDVKIQALSFTSFYGGQPKPAAAETDYARPAAGQSDLAAIKRTTYDAAFWQNNSAVKRTPLEEQVIKSFEQKGAFGTLLPH